MNGDNEACGACGGPLDDGHKPDCPVMEFRRTVVELERVPVHAHLIVSDAIRAWFKTQPCCYRVSGSMVCVNGGFNAVDLARYILVHLKT